MRVQSTGHLWTLSKAERLKAARKSLWKAIGYGLGDPGLSVSLQCNLYNMFVRSVLEYGAEIHVASFASGYVRRTKANGYSPSWQLNKTRKIKSKHGWDMIQRILIPKEADRLDYLIAFCLKNYYIGQANMLSSGRFVPKWKYDDLADAARLDYENSSQTYYDGYSDGFNDGKEEPEVQVIVNGHRYKVI